MAVIRLKRDNAGVIELTQVEPRVRSWVSQWTPARLRSLEYESKSGILTRVGDLTDIIITDDRISAVVNVRVNGLLGAPVKFYYDDDDTDLAADDDDPVIRALSADFWRMYPESALSELVRWSLLVGVGIAQHIWFKNPVTKRLEPRIEVWHPSNYGYDMKEGTWYVKTVDGKYPIKAGDGSWIIYTPFGEKRPWTWGLWRLLGRWWLLKQYAVTDWARHSEAHGKPAYIIKTTDKNSNQLKNDREGLVSDLQNIGELEAIGMPYGFDVDLLEATTTAYRVFAEQIKQSNDGIAVAVLGQNLTTSVSGGSLAAARVHEQVRGDIRRYDEQTLSTTLRQQSIAYWTQYNFGKKQEVPWARWDTSEPEDRGLQAETQQKRADALVKFVDFLMKARGLGLELDIAVLADEFAIPLEKAEELADISTHGSLEDDTDREDSQDANDIKVDIDD